MVTEFGSPEVVRSLGAAGFDFVFIDTEHGPFNPETVVNLIRAARGAHVTPLVRVAEAEYSLIARTLDFGAQGVMVPRVETVSEVRRIVAASRYPPVGKRGYGVRPVIHDYEKYTVEGIVRKLNEDTMVVLQIERRAAINRIESMVSVPGVNAVLMGPNDLSVDLGVPGREEDPSMIKATQRVLDACSKAGVACGTHTRNLKNLLYWQKKGMRLLTYSTDLDLMRDGADTALKSLRAR